MDRGRDLGRGIVPYLWTLGVDPEKNRKNNPKPCPKTVSSIYPQNLATRKLGPECPKILFFVRMYWALELGGAKCPSVLVILKNNMYIPYFVRNKLCFTSHSILIYFLNS